VEAPGIEAGGSASRNVANGRQSSRIVASDVREVTVRDETRRAIAKPRSARAALVADLADHLKVLVHADELEAARVASSAIASLFGSWRAGSPVVDLARERARRGDK
jgi:hypothetical protein